MTRNQWMSAMYGLGRQSDSMRCMVGSYMYEHSPHSLRVKIICDVLDYTEAQVRSELSRIARRLKRYNIPFQLKWDGKETVALVPAIKND